MLGENKVSGMLLIWVCFCPHRPQSFCDSFDPGNGWSTCLDHAALPSTERGQG